MRILARGLVLAGVLSATGLPAAWSANRRRVEALRQELRSDGVVE